MIPFTTTTRQEIIQFSIQLDNYYDLQSKYVSIIYNSGDGNDIDTLKAYYKDSYYKRTSGSDVIVSVDDGKITLSGAAILRYTNVDFRKTETVDESKTDSKLITLTEGNDTYNNSVEGVTINALGGNDLIGNSSSNVSIDAGMGNDKVLNGGYWDDKWNEGGERVTIKTYEGDDYIQNFYGNINYALIDGGSGNDSIINSNTGSNSTLKGSSGNDHIENIGGYNVVIDGGTENDFISNSGNDATIYGGNGNDTIYNDAGSNISINGGAGNDFIRNRGKKATIESGAGEDIIWNASGSDSVTLEAGSGNDCIYNNGDKVTINTGTGNDLISLNAYDNLSAYENLIIYNSGDGNDIIYGFKADSTLSIGGGSYSSKKSGDDIIVTVGKGKISLIGAASLSAVNIVGEETPIETNTWTLEGTTAKYGTTSNTLIKITNVKSLDGISLSGNVVTIANTSVNKKKITLTGDGYTLALDDDVTAPTSKKAAWSYKNGIATYKSSYKTAGYKLASNAKSITYSKKSTTTLATVKGVKSKNGLSISGKVITVAESAVNEKKITISGDGYTLKLADGLAPTTKKAAWSYKNGTVTYKSSYKTAGYNLASNSKSISYSKATTATTLATVKGATSKSGLSVSGKKITLKNSALSKKVTVSGGYEFDFAKDYGSATISGSSKADTITARGKKISVNGGKGNDTVKIFGSGTVSGGDGTDIFYYKSSGSNVIADYAAEDKISIASGTATTSTSGDDLIFTIGSGKISVTGAANETVTYFDANGEHIYKKSSDTLEGVKFTKSGKVVTLTDDYEADKFDVADFSNYKNKIVTINAAKVSQALEIIGNKKSNVITGTTDKDKIYGLSGADTIRGGKGGDYIEGGDGDDEIYGGEGSDSLWGGDDDDILTGGAGKDFFIYEGNDDGNDTITDYADIDSIMILSGEKPALAYTPQSNNMTFNIGNGSIVIENPQGQNINFVKGDGTYLHHEAVIRSAH